MLQQSDGHNKIIGSRDRLFDRLHNKMVIKVFIPLLALYVHTTIFDSFRSSQQGSVNSTDFENTAKLLLCNEKENLSVVATLY